LQLNLDEKKDLELEPYKLYKVLVPLKSMIPSESYWIRIYHNGGHANDAIMRRQQVKAPGDNLEARYVETQFYKKFGKTLQKGLKDHVYAQEFTLD
jgi:hypothetical protein